MSKPLILLHDASLAAERGGAVLNFSLAPDEHVAVVGPNGSGKTRLVETLTGRHALRAGRLESDCPGGGVRYVAFHETYNRAEDGEYYYQQRWNSCDNENAPRVSELLGRMECDSRWREGLYERLEIGPMLEKPVILLSSGELRKFQIVRMLLTSARVLAIDNPFIGLDVEARRVMDDLLGRLAESTGIRLILLLPDGEELPGFVTHVCRMEEGRIGPKIPAAEFRNEAPVSPDGPIVCPAPERPAPTCAETVAMRGVTVRYGGRTILDGLDWTIRPGERWALSGPNGSGKSTLLSLISADNPQAYAQDIVLFGRQRGTGESIWEIKRRIGYVSSELHRSFRKEMPTVRLVASGYFDSLGLYETPTGEQLAAAEAWMRTFGIGELTERSFLQLSSGEQRLALLARAFVKDPDLLILDEPLNGLDAVRKERVKTIIDVFCGRSGKSLIYVSHCERDLPLCITHRLALRRLD